MGSFNVAHTLANWARVTRSFRRRSKPWKVGFIRVRCCDTSSLTRDRMPASTVSSTPVSFSVHSFGMKCSRVLCGSRSIHSSPPSTIDARLRQLTVDGSASCLNASSRHAICGSVSTSPAAAIAVRNLAWLRRPMRRGSPSRRKFVSLMRLRRHSRWRASMVSSKLAGPPAPRRRTTSTRVRSNDAFPSSAAVATAGAASISGRLPSTPSTLSNAR
mmetsp:Transcript_135129/g.328432  ORF Transcript_135129/g.328432 Transcript_135129/m.328432 type:complete len:216 (+) Transcript_135129:246-893(+)